MTNEEAEKRINEKISKFIDESYLRGESTGYKAGLQRALELLPKERDIFHTQRLRQLKELQGVYDDGWNVALSEVRENIKKELNK